MSVKAASPHRSGNHYPPEQFVDEVMKMLTGAYVAFYFLSCIFISSKTKDSVLAFALRYIAAIAISIRESIVLLLPLPP